MTNTTTTHNDNRMLFVRNLEKLEKTLFGDPFYLAEYEIASECYIGGVLHHKDSKIILSPLTIEKNSNGLYYYTVKITHARERATDYWKNAEKNGYYFPNGIVGELIVLLSLYYRCRFYLTAIYAGELSATSIRVRTDCHFLYLPCDHKIHPHIFTEDGKNFTRFGEFLDSFTTLDEKYHYGFILACYHYNKALKEVGIDAEMVYIRLVSAIEALSGFIKLAKAEDKLVNFDIGGLLKKSGLNDQDKAELKKVFDVRKSRQKFLKIIKLYSKGYLKGGHFSAPHCKITKKKLPSVLRAIYDARSNYLHSGLPMYVSRPMCGGEKWDTDPSAGMIVGNRKFEATQKLPYTYFFEGLVRSCLLNFLKENTTK